MSAHEIMMYQVKCDCCGAIEDDYGNFSAFTDFGVARAEASDVGWIVADDEDLCEKCWCWPEDLPDYPGYNAWTGTDDPVRRPDCHQSTEQEQGA